MNHLVLARAYRPKNFADVVGQDLIVSTLKAAIEKNRMAHALLFTGGRGIGKTTIARIVAKALVCLDRKDSEPCNACAQCVSVDNFSSLDVIEIDGASHTSVDDVRDLRESARFQPTSAKYKIFIIDEVHMLSISAFNALLKILEEPPAHIIFIFATTESHKIPQTILSRCQRYDFKRLSKTLIEQTLITITAKESVQIDEKALKLIASLADGAMRDALSMCEQILSSGESFYSAEKVAQILGVVSQQAIKELCEALLSQEIDKALFLLKDVYENGLDLCQMMDGMAERFRLLSLCAHVDEKKATVLLPGLDPDDFKLASLYQKEDLKRLFAMAIDHMPQVFASQKPLLAMELFALKAALRPALGEAMSINYCLQKLDAIMHNRPVPPEPSWLKQPTQEVPVKKSLEPQAGSKIAVTEDVVELFSKLLNNIVEDLPGLSAHLRLGRARLENNELIVSFDQALHYERAMDKKNDPSLKQAIEAVFGSKTLKFELKTDHKNTKTVAELDQEKYLLQQKALHEEALKNPIIKKALEMFSGDITEVKRLENHLSPTTT
jgi:DNA polymerase-3 subunit gamma/tau